MAGHAASHSSDNVALTKYQISRTCTVQLKVKGQVMRSSYCTE